MDGRLGIRVFGAAVVACTRERLLKEAAGGQAASGGDDRRNLGACVTSGLEELGDQRLAAYLYGDPLPLQLRQIRCNREVFVARYRRSLLEDEELSASQVDCYLDELRRLSDRDLAETVLSYSDRSELSERCS